MTKYGRIEVDEEVFRLGREGAELRPFQTSAEVECRGYSRPLQRVMVDFGAEGSFDKGSERIREHYGIEVPASAVRRVTLSHAQAIEQQQEDERDGELVAGPGAETVIAELDGSLVPIVVTEPTGADRRRGKQLKWEEARLASARAVESVTPQYGATMGSVEEAGEVLADCVRRAGASQQTPLHCLGDGAAWIAQQVQKQFGEQGSYLLDFYHVSEYLAAAAPVVAPGQAERWRHQQQEQLLNNRVDDVLAALAPCCEPLTVADADAPVRRCWRYLDNHRQYLDYQSARQAGLPIGSGEVESGHRSVIQHRLKIAGAWWLRPHAEAMIALRVNRANHQWQAYWHTLRQAVA
jgi:hypothetical protein